MGLNSPGGMPFKLNAIAAGPGDEFFRPWACLPAMDQERI